MIVPFSADRESVALQGRAEREGAKRRSLVGAAGLSGSHSRLLHFVREGSAATARTGNPGVPSADRNHASLRPRARRNRARY